MGSLKRTAAAMFGWLIFLIAGTTMSGCTNAYQVGDISRLYCHSTSDEFKTAIRATLSDKGIKVGIDYCAIHGLVEVVKNDGA